MQRSAGDIINIAANVGRFLESEVVIISHVYNAPFLSPFFLPLSLLHGMFGVVDSVAVLSKALPFLHPQIISRTQI